MAIKSKKKTALKGIYLTAEQLAAFGNIETAQAVAITALNNSLRTAGIEPIKVA
jgi:hypothetical protein